MEIHLTAREIEEGTATKFWKAVEAWLEESLETIHYESEDMDGAQDFGTFKRLGGNAQTIRRVMVLPEIFMDDIEDKRLEKGDE